MYQESMQTFGLSSLLAAETEKPLKLLEKLGMLYVPSENQNMAVQWQI